MAKGNKEKEHQDIVEKFMAAPLSPAVEAQKEEITDTVVLSNKRKLKLNPTKLKYFKNGDYAMYKLMEQIGVADILSYVDGFDIVCKFLSAVFDKPYKVEEIKDDEGNYSEIIKYDEYVSNLVEDELNIKDLENIIKSSLNVNGIKSENF